MRPELTSRHAFLRAFDPVLHRRPHWLARLAPRFTEKDLFDCRLGGKLPFWHALLENRLDRLNRGFVDCPAKTINFAALRVDLIRSESLFRQQTIHHRIAER